MNQKRATGLPVVRSKLLTELKQAVPYSLLTCHGYINFIDSVGNNYSFPLDNFIRSVQYVTDGYGDGRILRKLFELYWALVALR